MSGFREITSGLKFPEGPVAMSDGSVVLVEIEGQCITRVAPDGRKTVVAKTGGGPNGAAIGPDSKLYVCNNGGFVYHHHEGYGITMPAGVAPDYAGGSIQRVDLQTGAVETLYTHAGEVPLRGPNDIVFDAEGGFWFTDHGKSWPRSRDRVGVFYARPDGSFIEEVAFPMENPNGIGLSPDGKRLYVAETYTCQLWAFDIAAPGKIAPTSGLFPHGGRFLFRPAGFKHFDSLAVDSAGNICVATIGEGGITVVAPDGQSSSFVPTPDLFPTNICFGGPELRTAYITLSGTGKLVSMEWPRPGLALHWLNI